MAKKKQAETHSQRLADAMKSIYTASTPLTSILPVQEKIEVSESSQAARTKGTRSPSTSTMPQKLLLQITDPGDAPRQPTVVANPGTMASPNFSNAGFRTIPASFSAAKGSWNPAHPAYRQEAGQMQTAINAYNNYTSALATYNRNLSDYNTAVAQRASQTRTNTTRTSQYQKDLAKFFATSGSSKVSKKRATRTRGSRNPSTSGSKGSRK